MWKVPDLWKFWDSILNMDKKQQEIELENVKRDLATVRDTLKDFLYIMTLLRTRTSQLRLCGRENKENPEFAGVEEIEDEE